KEGSTEVTALHPITLDVKVGEFIGVVGPSGSGKSTLLSIAGALLSPSEGNIYIREKNITHLSEKEMTDIRLNKIGFVFQFANLVP
ncbi:ATP-binding cassette domain-containing protein, partial [Bacillus cereus]|uniref:ATP-binding cassette domain-containing protein n=2 Tax=Bacillaceae TaxID=186817 RepID=UPI0018F7B1C6